MWKEYGQVGALVAHRTLWTPDDKPHSSMWPAIGSIFGKGNWVDLKLEGDVSAAPFGDGCKKGI